jgi:hypothetical protein
MGDVVNQGRRGARIEGDFVVFLIGARPDKLHPIRSFRDLGAMRGMPYMLKYLTERPEKGLLGYDTYGLFMNVQYWRSFEHLERYAREPAASHLPAWRAFNRRVRGSGDVGIWHETYRVRDGEYESIYGNMPRVGLAKAADHVALGSTSTAARRLGTRPDDDAPVPGY